MGQAADRCPAGHQTCGIRPTAPRGLIYICLLLFAALVPQAAPAGTAARMPPKEEPITITSDRMEASAAGDVVTFSGNVVATQAEGMLKARNIKVYYRTLPDSKEQQRQIQRIEAEGGVMIVQGKRIATGEKAVYSATDRTIVLSGQAKVKQEQDWVRGSRITLYLDDSRSVVEGAPGKRVESIIYPKGERRGVIPGP
ncbi:MAG: lipopolysaccharide transport periplasmic protein LptA [Pseudomonadota bacterium]